MQSSDLSFELHIAHTFFEEPAPYAEAHEMLESMTSFTTHEIEALLAEASHGTAEWIDQYGIRVRAKAKRAVQTIDSMVA